MVVHVETSQSAMRFQGVCMSTILNTLHPCERGYYTLGNLSIQTGLHIYTILSGIQENPRGMLCSDILVSLLVNRFQSIFCLVFILLFLHRSSSLLLDYFSAKELVLVISIFLVDRYPTFKNFTNGLARTLACLSILFMTSKGNNNL